MIDKTSESRIEISPGKSGRIFLSFFIRTLFVVAALSSGIQLIRFYNVTSLDQKEYDTIKNETAVNVRRSTSRFTKGVIIELSGQPNSLENDPSSADVIVVNDELNWLTPITGSEYNTGDPTVSLPFSPTPSPSIQASVINVNPSPTPRAKNPQTGEIDFSAYRGGMGIDFKELYDTNPDVVGWIRISGTPVDYPVVQGEDNDYYLNRSFKRSKSSSGVPFLDFTNAYDPADSNLVIYGHNMGSGKTTMFSSLLKYYDQNYFSAHPTIEFDTLSGAGTWRIFSVFKFDVNNISDFNYTQHNFGSLADFQAFIANARELSLYDCGIIPEYGSHIITLSTCDRATYGRTGRCVVMAVYSNGNMF